MPVIRILGLGANNVVDGSRPTPYDGQFLAHYDPDRPGFDPDGEPMIATVQTTPERAEALEFKNGRAALECYRLVSKRQPVRDDGRPNRPLMAFAIEVLP